MPPSPSRLRESTDNPSCGPENATTRVKKFVQRASRRFEGRAGASPDDELGDSVQHLAVCRPCRRLFVELKMYDAVVSVDAIQHVSSIALANFAILSNSVSGWTVMLKS